MIDVPQGWGKLGHKIFKDRYAFTPDETWEGAARRVAGAVFSPLPDRGISGALELTMEAERYIAQRKFMPGGRYLAQAGRGFHQVQNCLLKIVDDDRESWGDHICKHMLGLSTGAGMGTVYSRLRRKGAPLVRTGGVASGPVPLIRGTNDFARPVRQGGNRRAALWAGLHWWHEDVMDFVVAKNWPEEITRLKAQDWEFPAPLDMTNISVCLDDEFMDAMINQPGCFPGWPGHPKRALAEQVYWATINNALRIGDPGLSIDVLDNAGEWLRNACTEVSSRDNDDICNIASINLARVESLEEFKTILIIAIAFLLAGTLYSDVPYPDVARVREKNRRLGLGLMGVHEWLLKRGKKYGPDPELALWLAEYAKSTEIARRLADAWGISPPVKTRAMAPNGTNGMVAETTTCMEPLLCVAKKRRVKEGDNTWAQYVIDPVAERLIHEGIKPDTIETAYSLAETHEGIERRVAFQAWFQQYVDHGIASTINLPSWGSPQNNEDSVKWFGEMLLRYLPKLRGITVYPDGARGGQPITQVRYETALRHRDQIIYETGDVCDLRGGGSCGS